MDESTGVQVKNWEGSIISYPSIVVHPRTVEDIVAIMKDSENYPSPVRAIGSNHSTTRCGVADGGTVVNMRNMDRIIEIGPDTVTVEAGALYIDVARELQKHGLQFYVNVELGNLTIGSAASGGTKDASMPGEFGQVCSYATVIKLVTPSGELMEVTENQADLLKIMRSSYGLLGIIYEVTFKVRPIQPLVVRHVTYSLDDFVSRMPALAQMEESMMFYLYPFLKSVTVEFRRYGDASGPPSRIGWRLRNLSWGRWVPALSYLVTRLVPVKSARFLLFNGISRLTQVALKWIVRGSNTIATDQIIRYPDKSGVSKYTFSIWAFPEEQYTQRLREYYEFCRAYYDRTGFRCNMLNVGYRISKDISSHFSYSYDGTVMTLDPVATGGEGWNDFLKAYNEFCSERGGVPLFNQTTWITPQQARTAFGERLEIFDGYRKEFDPTDRLLNEYFRDILGYQG